MTIVMMLSIIIIGGCTEQIENRGALGIDSTDVYNLTELILNCESGLVDKNECYLDVAVKMRNVSYCLNVTSQRFIPECITQYAIMTDNVTACTTKYRFVDNARMVSYTNAYRYKCYYDYAFAKEDRSVCELMEPQNEEAKLLKNYCFAVFDEDVDACSRLEVDYYIRDEYDSVQGDCRIEVAIRTKDVTICESALENEDGPYGVYLDRRMDGVFLTDCYSKVAPIVGDRSLCERAKPYPYKYIPCVGAFILPEEVTDFCDTYKPDFIFSYNMGVQCVKDLVVGNDCSFCDGIMDESYNAQCVGAIC
ncbi:hypothetical protein GQ473_07680 [archaeon]|nr:hypothetical protein [archaeon]